MQGEAAVKKFGPPAEVIIAEYDAILSHWERANFYFTITAEIHARSLA